MNCQVNLPEIDCRRTDVPPAIDAAHFDSVWAVAVPSHLYLLRKNAEFPAMMLPVLPTEFRCLWDAENLYVRFDCKSPDVWADKTARDDSLWDGPVVEVFLDVAGAGKSFFEFQVNPLGAIYDSFVPDASQSGDWQRWCKWNCQGLRVSVHVDGRLNDRSHVDNGWSAVLAIPLASLENETKIRPAAGSVLRANFCRYDYSSQLPQKPELSCWAPVAGCYDDLPRFGFLKFEK